MSNYVDLSNIENHIDEEVYYFNCDIKAPIIVKVLGYNSNCSCAKIGYRGHVYLGRFDHLYKITPLWKVLYGKGS